jgi:hypothetical protein
MVQHHEDDRDAAQAVQRRNEACLGALGCCQVYLI